MEIRKEKPTDTEQIDKGIDLVYDLIELNPQIESTLWLSVFVFMLMEGHRNNKIPYYLFRQEMNRAFEHYREYYEE